MKIWIHINGQQLGPYEFEQLPVDEMTARTPVWYEGLSRWTAAGDAPVTAPLFLASTQAVPTDSEIKVTDNSSTSVSTPWQSAQADESPTCPPTYLVWSILLTICCCNPVGIIPIITGSQVSSKFNNMDFEGARRASEATEWWVIICFVIGLIMLPFTVIAWL